MFQEEGDSWKIFKSLQNILNSLHNEWSVPYLAALALVAVKDVCLETEISHCYFLCGKENWRAELITEK